MSQHSQPELQLLQLVQQRDNITAQINTLLQAIVGGSTTANQAVVLPVKSAAPAKASSSKKPATPKSAVPGAAPRKRGRPVGWRKAAGGVVPELAKAAAAKSPAAPKAPDAAKAAPAPGAAPRKRGRPVGWRKAAGGVVPALAKAAVSKAATTKSSAPSKAPAAAKAAPAPGSAPRKRGRPVGWRKAAGGVVPELAVAAATKGKSSKKSAKAKKK